MTSKAAWGSSIGAWALEAERAEEEEREEASRAARTPPPSFPSPAKQKKKTKTSLQEFTKASGNPHYGPPRVSEFDEIPSRADEADNWGTMKKVPALAQMGARSSFGSRVEVLTENKVGGISRPTSSQSHSVGFDGAGLHQVQEVVMEVLAVKPKPKVNPFGDAKPREVSLAEKGVDYKKIDFELEHKRVHRPETDEEKNLKEEIENLKKDSLQKSDEEQNNVHGEIIEKEKALELLIRELDDKVRFGQKIIDRPGSGSGRYTGPPSRHSSRHGPLDEPRGNVEFMDRPRSRGTVDSLPRQNGDKRSFSGGRDRGGFPGSRELDRSSPRSRW